jgi:hypothetical protein
MAAESTAQKIRANIVTTLEGISKTGTFHGPTPTVVQVDEFNSRRYLAPAHAFQRVFWVRDTSPEVKNQGTTTMGFIARDVTIFVMLLERRDEEWDPYESAGVSPGTVRDRMIQDAVTKLYIDKTRGALALHTEILEPARDFEEPSGWVVAELPVIVTYHHTEAVL